MTLDDIKNIIEYLAIIVSVVFLVMRANDFLRYYKQHRYQIKPTVNHITWQIKKYWYVVTVVPFIFILDRWYFQLIYVVFITSFIVIYSKKRDKHNQELTVFLLFLYFLHGAILTVIGTLLMHWLMLVSLVSLFALCIVLLPLYGWISLYLLYPLQRTIFYAFRAILRRKMNRLQATTIMYPSEITLDIKTLDGFLKHDYILLPIDEQAEIEKVFAMQNRLMQKNTVILMPYQTIEKKDLHFFKPQIIISKEKNPLIEAYLEPVIVSYKACVLEEIANGDYALTCLNKTFAITKKQCSETLVYTIFIACALKLDQGLIEGLLNKE